jgi:hypothetical protein
MRNVRFFKVSLNLTYIKVNIYLSSPAILDHLLLPLSTDSCKSRVLELGVEEIVKISP